MPVGQPRAIYLANPRRPKHRFNENAIGQGRDYLNEIPTDTPCIIRINVGIPRQRLAKRFPLLQAATVACHVNTDCKPTVFQGRIADQLNLWPVEPFLRRVTTFVGSYVGWWSKHELWLGIGPGYMPLEVWFPVKPGPRGWEWRYGFPRWNVLGMTNVLNRRMLCLTSDEIYAFERL